MGGWYLPLQDRPIVPEHILEGGLKIKESLARAEACAPPHRVLDALEESQT